MTAIKIGRKRTILNDKVLDIFKGKITKFGNGAHVILRKGYENKEVLVVVVENA